MARRQSAPRLGDKASTRSDKKLAFGRSKNKILGKRRQISPCQVNDRERVVVAVLDRHEDHSGSLTRQLSLPFLYLVLKMKRRLHAPLLSVMEDSGWIGPNHGSTQPLSVDMAVLISIQPANPKRPVLSE
jgi:hypothetical protein